jgi:hypothetical protein
MEDFAEILTPRKLELLIRFHFSLTEEKWQTLLRNYPAGQLMGDDLLAVETSISTYDITNKEDSSHHHSHSLSHFVVYISLVRIKVH